MEPTLKFYGGRLGAAVPLLFFVVWAIAISVAGVPSEHGLILGMVIGLTVGMLLCRSRWADYANAIFTGMASPVATVTIVAWFWAGMFAQVLRVGGLVDGLVWLGGQSNATGGFFVGATFVLAATFGTAVGTGYGTTVAFCTLMFPAGLILGADPVWLFAAILSGAAFGDNLAPVSDTTVVSATTQETDIPGVVRSRVKYALLAALPALVLFILLGGDGMDPDRAQAAELLADTASPNGLALLAPFALVIFLALSGYHILVSLTWGIVTAIAVELLLGLAPPEAILFFDPSTDTVGGALVDGIAGYLGLSILILLIVAAGHLMRLGGALDALIDALKRFARASVARAEAAMWGIVFSLNAFITINTAAEIAAAPVISQLGKRFRLHPYRRANMLDAVTSAIGYIFPWGGGVLIGYQTIRTLESQYDFVHAVSPTDVWPFVLHGWFLAAVMLLAALTGFGRSYEAADGSETKTPPEDLSM
ncbi:MAG: Na+/H+ antiporter NhaC family protein [Gammaproteobacteria bacterium]|nr:Na+/H+ antiporter NhaC family protein [Gammaproteobacteria bacterium]MDH3748954.1 Na+/H+ antiporter NhaC family protein [Gammaproteobacteria bacterium]